MLTSFVLLSRSSSSSTFAQPTAAVIRTRRRTEVYLLLTGRWSLGHLISSHLAAPSTLRRRGVYCKPIPGRVCPDAYFSPSLRQRHFSFRLTCSTQCFFCGLARSTDQRPVRRPSPRYQPKTFARQWLLTADTSRTALSSASSRGVGWTHVVSLPRSLT